MKSYSPDAIRNVGLFGHGGAGKTSLAEALLFQSGAVSRQGRVDDGSATTDYDPDEIKRKMSVSAGLAPLEWRDTKINVIDAPGYADFLGEVVQAMSAIECALIVVDGVSGLQVGTATAWRQADAVDLPRAVVINKLERENADFRRVFEQIRARHGTGAIALTIPVGSEASFRGVVNVLHQHAVLDEKKGPEAVPGELVDELARYREMLIESVAEMDDDLLAKYLEAGDLADNDIQTALRRGIEERRLFPVFAASATQNHGTSSLLDAIVEFGPPASDAQVRIESGEGQNGLAALVFKTVSDPFIGRLSYLRAFRGEIHSDSHVWNQTHQKDERIGQLYMMRGKTQEPAAVISLGDIGVVVKLSETGTGDTLTHKDHPVILKRPHFPEPLYSMAIQPKNKADLDKLSPSLHRIVEEDPTLSVHREATTGEMILAGLGESHLEIACERMTRKFGVSVTLSPPRVPYRETIRGRARAEGRHVKQSGGHGQYGVCWVEVEPLERGAGFEFVDKIVGGVVSHNFRPAVEKGIREAMEEGVLAGYPMVDVRAKLVDGKEHPVDSSEMAFKLAGAIAFKKAAQDAGVELIEPVMEAEITVPDEYTGDVIGDLNTKRAHVHGMVPDNGETMISATVPQAEMLKYATDLRAQTQGRGTYTMHFSHYQEVPAHVAQALVEKLKKEHDEAHK